MCTYTDIILVTEMAVSSTLILNVIQQPKMCAISVQCTGGSCLLSFIMEGVNLVGKVEEEDDLDARVAMVRMVGLNLWWNKLDFPTSCTNFAAGYAQGT